MRLSLAILVLTVSVVADVTPDQYLASRPKPSFAVGNHLPKLSKWSWPFAMPLRVEMATNWGYALEFNNQPLYDIGLDMADPTSPAYQALQLALQYPSVYPLSISVDRFWSYSMPPGLTLSKGMWVTNVAGEYVDNNTNTWTVWGDHNAVVSPEAPDSDWNTVATFTASPLARIVSSNAPIAIIQNGGEYGMDVSGFGQAWKFDPRVSGAMATNGLTWGRYSSNRKAHQNQIVTDAIRAAVPSRGAYIWYNTALEENRYHQPGYTWSQVWGWDSDVMNATTDYASLESYYTGTNCWGPFDYWYTCENLLTKHLDSVGYNLSLASPKSQFYVWVNGGWGTNAARLSDMNRYTGFLKCLYTAGTVGAVAGYFDYPDGGFNASFPIDNPPHWLQQIEALSRVHALWTYLERYTLDGYLLPGPTNHFVSTDQSAYEFPINGDFGARVLARKRNSANDWLITAWNAYGSDRSVSVTIPTLGAVNLIAASTGNVYRATLVTGVELVNSTGGVPSDLTPVYSTYYVDFVGGNDANIGTDKAHPWKRCPGMAGFAATYAHTAGDHFIFKGGVTWDKTCFTMQISAGGTPASPDYYGVDPTWYTGGSWTRPIWDWQSADVPYCVMLLFNLNTAPHDVILDNIDMRRLYWSGSKNYSWVAYVNLSQSQNITIQNCFIHNWSHGSTGVGTSDSLKCIIGYNSAPWNYGCTITNCVFDGETTPNSTQGQSSGEATYAFSGNVVNSTFRNMASGIIVTGDPASPTFNEVHGNDLGPLYMSFDSGAHPDGLFMNGGNRFKWYNNYFHDNYVMSIFCGNGSGSEQTYIWNNVIYNCHVGGSGPIVVDNAYSGARIYFWNNTLVGGASFTGIHIQTRGRGPIGVIDMRNNFVVSDQAIYDLAPGQLVLALTNQNNVLLSVANATAQGYTTANIYQPMSPSGSTYGAGQDMATVLGGVLTSDIRGVTRPQSGNRWDAGAYEYVGAAPNPGVLALVSGTYNTTETSGSVTLSVMRTLGSDGVVSVNYATANGSAVSGHDYTATSGVLSWANGDTANKTITVPILNSGDTALTNRTFTVTLSGATGGASVGSPGSATVSIAMTPPTPVPGTIRWAASSYSAAETNASVTLTAQRVSGSDGAVGISWATADGSAVAGHDYTAGSSTLSWGNGDTANKTVTVNLIDSGDTPCINRSFTVNLSTPTGGATLGSPASAMVEIVMNCPQPPIPPSTNTGTIVFSAPAVTVSLSSGTVILPVQRLNGTNGAASVQYTTVNGSAVSGTDYTATSGTLSWVAGDNSNKTISVPIINTGAIAAIPRTFSVVLSGVTGASLGAPASETVSILQDGSITATITINGPSTISGTVHLGK